MINFNSTLPDFSNNLQIVSPRHKFGTNKSYLSLLERLKKGDNSANIIETENSFNNVNGNYFTVGEGNSFNNRAQARTTGRTLGGTDVGGTLSNVSGGLTSMGENGFAIGNTIDGATVGDDGEQHLGAAFGSGAFKGMEIGTKLGSIGGPIGTAIGAGVGIIGGGLAKLFMAKKQNEKAKQIKQEREFKEKQNQMLNNINYSRSILSTYPTYGITDAGYWKYGGNITSKIKQTQGGNLKKLNNSSVKVEGNTHEEGGVNLYNDKLLGQVEDKEIITKLKDGKTVVFSNSLNTENGITFAKQAELLGKLKNREEKSIDKDNNKINEIDNETKLLFDAQENLKSSSLFSLQGKDLNNNNEIMKYNLGGEFKELDDIYSQIRTQYGGDYGKRKDIVPNDLQQKFSNAFVNSFKNNPLYKDLALKELTKLYKWKNPNYQGNDNDWDNLQSTNLKGGWRDMTESMYNVYEFIKDKSSLQLDKIPSKLPTINNPSELTNAINSLTTPLQELKSNNLKLRDIEENTEENINLNNYKGFNLDTGSFVPYLDNVANLALTKKTPQIPIPTMLRAARLKTDFNINPQLSNINTELKGLYDNLDNNTNNSTITRSNKLAALANSIKASNELYGQKENIETDLKNKQSLNNQEVENVNIQKIDDYNFKKMLRKNDIQTRLSQNVMDSVNDTQFNKAQENLKDLDYKKLDLVNIMYQGNSAALRNTLPMQIEIAKDNPKYFKVLKRKVESSNNKELKKLWNELVN